MKCIINKQGIACLSFVCLTLYANNIFAQFTSVPTRISTPRGNVTIPMQQFTPRYYGNYENQNRKHDFTIVLLNDSVVSAKTRINISDSVHTLEWGKKEKKTIIKPSDTKEIYRMEDGRKISGIAADSCWLFPVGTDKIRTYSITSETDYPLIMYIQNGENGPILLLTKENLVSMITDNEKARKLAEKREIAKSD